MLEKFGQNKGNRTHRFLQNRKRKKHKRTVEYNINKQYIKTFPNVDSQSLFEMEAIFRQTLEECHVPIPIP